MEFVDMLINILCPTSSAASQCQSFISAHSSVAPPFGQYIYFLFFPTVFLLLFLWIIFKDVIKANKGISLIASIAVFVFIIIQGFYPIFLWLGEAWIAVIFLLGFLYVLTRRFRGGGGGGGGKHGGGMSAPGTIRDLTKGISIQRGIDKLSGKEKTQAEYILAQIELLENSPRGAHGLDNMSETIKNELKAFGSDTSAGGKPVFSEYKMLFERYKAACRSKGIKVKE